MPKVRKIRLSNGNIRDGLLASRNNMLPREFVTHPLASWILSFDPLQSDWSESDRQFGCEPLEQTARIGRSEASSNSFKSLHDVVVQETYGFFFATLFHLGRIIDASTISQNRLSLLAEAMDKDPSIKSLILSHGNGDPKITPEELCRVNIEFQRFRNKAAKQGWLLWQRSVAALKLFSTLTSDNNVSLDNDLYTPHKKPKARIGWGTVAPMTFFLCSHLTHNFLLRAMLADRAHMRSVAFPSMNNILNVIERSAASYYDTSRKMALTSDSLLSLNKLITIANESSIGNEGSHWRHISTIVLSTADPLIRDRYRIHLASEPIQPKDDAPISMIPHLPMPTGSGNVLKKITKLFIVAGRRPPIWPSVKQLARDFSIECSMRDAGIDAKTLVDTFADDISAFGGLVAASSNSNLRYIPFSDEGWSRHLNSFFNDVWIPGLRTRWSKIESLTDEQFVKFVVAAASLLSAMGYAITPKLGGPLPPSGPKGQKNPSDNQWTPQRF